MAAFTRRQYKGAAVATTTTNSLNTTDTSVTIAANTGWPSSAGVPFYVVIDPGTSAEEKCSATISGTTLTLTRAQDDTTASAHSSGATIYPVFTANDADEANELVAKLTTKGDLLATDGSALNRLAVGTNDYVLKADSSATNGVAWGQVAAAGIASDAVTTAKILDANVTGAKLANLTVSTKTTSYTLVAADRNTRVVMNSASATTITVNTSLFSAGDTVWIHNIGAGTCTVTAGTATVTTSGSLALAQWGGGTLYAQSASSFIFFPFGGITYGTATGGTSSSITVGGVNYTLLTFTSDGTLTVTKSGLFDVFLVGGGGGGSAGQDGTNRSGGGGGAGGKLQTTVYLTANASITVGAGGAGGSGGAGAAGSQWGTQGGSSILGSLTAVAGGGAGINPFIVGVNTRNAVRGGCGGGGAAYEGGGSTTYHQGALSIYQNTNYGYAGGDGAQNGGAGGGGGIGGLGQNQVTSGAVGGAGGVGIDVSSFIGGSTLYKGGGGGGGGNTGGAGGSSIGGAGGGLGAAGSAGTANSGSGGGGGGNPNNSTSTAGGAGGSGIVYVRFKV